MKGALREKASPSRGAYIQAPVSTSIHLAPTPRFPYSSHLHRPPEASSPAVRPRARDGLRCSDTGYRGDSVRSGQQFPGSLLARLQRLTRCASISSSLTVSGKVKSHQWISPRFPAASTAVRRPPGSSRTSSGFLSSRKPSSTPGPKARPQGRRIRRRRPTREGGFGRPPFLTGAPANAFGRLGLTDPRALRSAPRRLRRGPGSSRSGRR